MTFWIGYRATITLDHLPFILDPKNDNKKIREKEKKGQWGIPKK